MITHHFSAQDPYLTIFGVTYYLLLAHHKIHAFISNELLAI